MYDNLTLQLHNFSSR